MTRPPRAKYHSDGKIYHEARRPGFAHTMRLPEELLDTYMALKNSLGPRKSHVDMVRFLFEASEPAITVVLQASEQRPVPENEDVVHLKLPEAGGATEVSRQRPLKYP
ncbi:hypothetical protein R1sor_018581 [Riccia sorocarpa]|uniref:Uncharacterized protein n=1 Tax=Riccia sorocarpa TaxID=122646 RepID=A0ABD3IDE4_9MARC